MKKETKGKNFVHKPIYEGGPKAMKKLIADNLRYPAAALENRIEGTVYVKYDIDHRGQVTDCKIVSGLGHGCDEEAVRLTKLFKFRVPKNRGLRVVFHKNIQIHFRLPKPAKTPKFTINYTSGEKETEKKGGHPKPAGGYSYTIKF